MFRALVAALLILTATSFAGPVATPLRVAVVDLDVLLSSSNVGKHANDQLAAKRKELTAKQAAGADFAKLEAELDEYRKTLVTGVMKGAQPSIDAIAKANNVQLVVAADQITWKRSETIPTADMTVAVIARVDATGAPPATPALKIASLRIATVDGDAIDRAIAAAGGASDAVNHRVVAALADVGAKQTLDLIIIKDGLSYKTAEPRDVTDLVVAGFKK